jgi:hypothetical protein
MGNQWWVERPAELVSLSPCRLVGLLLGRSCAGLPVSAAAPAHVELSANRQANPSAAPSPGRKYPWVGPAWSGPDTDAP